MKYRYNLIEILSKNEICSNSHGIQQPKVKLKDSFPKEVKLSAVKYVRDELGRSFKRATIARQCIRLNIAEVDRDDLVDKEEVVILSGELEPINPFTDVEALRLDDDGFSDFERPTYVSIIYDMVERIGVLYRANFIDDDECAGLPIVFGEDLADEPGVGHLDHLRELGLSEKILRSKGLVANLHHLA